MEDKLLVKRAKQGDSEAFAALMEHYQSRVYHLALRMTGSPEDAADLCQETFLNAWRGLPSFRGDSSFVTWLCRLASNACLDHLRREKKRKYLESGASLDDGESGLSAVLPDGAPGPQERLEQRERQEAVRAGLAKLSPEHRQVLLLRETAGLCYAEIAAVTGLEEGTVKSRIARARLNLREILRESGNFFAPASSKKEKTGKEGDGDGP